MRPTTDELHEALQRIHRVAMGESARSYMSIPPDRQRDADLMLYDAIDDLAAARALLERAQLWVTVAADKCEFWESEKVARALAAEIAAALR